MPSSGLRKHKVNKINITCINDTVLLIHECKYLGNIIIELYEHKNNRVIVIVMTTLYVTKHGIHTNHLFFVQACSLFLYCPYTSPDYDNKICCNVNIDVLESSYCTEHNKTFHHL